MTPYEQITRLKEQLDTLAALASEDRIRLEDIAINGSASDKKAALALYETRRARLEYLGHSMELLMQRMEVLMQAPRTQQAAKVS